MTTANDSDKNNASWLERLSQALFIGEPKDKAELIHLLRDAQTRDLLDNDTLSMVEALMAFTEKQVRDIMIPRPQMVVVKLQTPMSEFIPKIIQSGHSRFPVLDEGQDDVKGIILAKDLLQYTFGEDKKACVKDILRPAFFVPESKRLNALLKEFRAKHHHMAIVVDEYGGIAGLVTIEDVLEEIVGEIEDEFDAQVESNIKQQSHNTFMVDALTPIEEFNEHFAVELEDATYDTIGGLVTQQAGHVPKKGETILMFGFAFKILAANSRQVKVMEVSKQA